MQKPKVKVERSARFVTPIGLASYPTLVEPRAFDEGADPKFSCSILVSKGPEADRWLAELERHRGEAIRAMWDKKAPTNLERWGVTDGDDAADTNQHGHWVVKASSKLRPAVVGPLRSPIGEDEVYGGCFCRLSVQAKAYGTTSKGGVTLELIAVQKVRDGTPFSSAARARTEAVSDFSDLEANELDY